MSQMSWPCHRSIETGHWWCPCHQGASCASWALWLCARLYGDCRAEWPVLVAVLPWRARNQLRKFHRGPMGRVLSLGSGVRAPEPVGKWSWLQAPGQSGDTLFIPVLFFCVVSVAIRSHCLGRKTAKAKRLQMSPWAEGTWARWRRDSGHDGASGWWPGSGGAVCSRRVGGVLWLGGSMRVHAGPCGSMRVQWVSTWGTAAILDHLRPLETEIYLMDKL